MSQDVPPLLYMRVLLMQYVGYVSHSLLLALVKYLGIYLSRCQVPMTK